MELYPYIKALHIIFVVTWFAGLFYIVRLFIYYVEAQQKEAVERDVLTKQFRLMQKRLWYGITWPSAVLTLAFGSYLLYLTGLWKAPFMHVKLAFLVGLYAYHFMCQRIMNKITEENHKWTSFKLRLWNELATLFLVAIVFIIVLRNSISWIWGLAGLVVISVVLLLAIKWYRKRRDAAGEAEVVE